MNEHIVLKYTGNWTIHHEQFHSLEEAAAFAREQSCETFVACVQQIGEIYEAFGKYCETREIFHLIDALERHPARHLSRNVTHTFDVPNEVESFIVETETVPTEDLPPEAEALIQNIKSKEKN